MSVRVDTSSLIAGAVVVGHRGLGVTGATIRADTATGDHGPGYLFNDWDSGDDAKEFRGLIVTPPSAGTFYAYEDGSFTLTGAPDGAYGFTYRLFVDGVDLGTASATLTIGGTNAAATGTLAALQLTAPNATATGTANAAAAGVLAAVQLTAPTGSAEAVGPTFHRPSGDISTGGWVASPGGTLASCIDEAAADDGDHITSPNTSTPAVVSFSPAMTAGTRTIRLRAARTGATGQVRVRLLDAANVDVGGTAWQALTTTPTTYTLAATLTATADRYRIEVQP